MYFSSSFSIANVYTVLSMVSDPEFENVTLKEKKNPPTAVSGLRQELETYVMLFWWRVSRVLLRSSVVALLSMLRKRSMAEMLRWMLCFGMSSLDMKVKLPPSSKLNSIGQQSWPFKAKDIFLTIHKKRKPLSVVCAVWWWWWWRRALRVVLLPLQQCCSQTQRSHSEEQGTRSSTGFA